MGRVAFAFFVLFGMVAQAFAADGPLGIGSIKLGMTYDEVKAATPGVTWTNTDYGSLFSDDAVTLGKDRFAVGYSLSAWGRISLRARHVNTESDAEACLAQFSAMAEVAEASIAPFGLDPLKVLAQEKARRMLSKTPPAVTITAIKIGKRSTAALTRADTPAGSENAANFYAGSWFRADKNEAELTARYSQSASGRRCELDINLKHEPPRPPYGDIAFDDLVVVGRPSVGWLHHSLDGAPALPAEGVDVSFSCSIPAGPAGSPRANRCLARSRNRSCARRAIGWPTSRLPTKRETADGRRKRRRQCAFTSRHPTGARTLRWMPLSKTSSCSKRSRSGRCNHTI